MRAAAAMHVATTPQVCDSLLCQWFEIQCRKCHINANINTNTEFLLLASDKVLIQMTHCDLKVESNIWKEGKLNDYSQTRFSLS